MPSHDDKVEIAMSDTISDADKIRNKRLAKLGAPSSSQDLRTSSETQDSTSAGQPHTQPSKELPHTSSPASNPLLKTSLQQEHENGPQLHIRPSTTGPGNFSRPDRPVMASGKARTAREEPLDVWEDKMLSGIFRWSLDPNKNQDGQGHSLHYLSNVREELVGQRAPIILSTTIIDQAILEATSKPETITPLDYLLACWKRVSRQFKIFKAEDSKHAIIREARRLCMSYCIFAITMPEMFGREAPLSSPLTTHLLVEQDDDHGICHEFLTEIIFRFPEDDSARDAMMGAIEDLGRQVASMSMNDNYKPYVLALRNLVRYPQMINAIAESPLFLPKPNPTFRIERDTLLGPFFQISPLQADVTTNYFSSPQTRDKGYVASSQNALRMSLRTHQADLLDIANCIIRAGKEPREKMLDWFARAVNTNHKRRAIQVDPATVSSDAVMINITVCLDQLCEPFMDATFSKIDRIDLEYLHRNPRVNIREETKLNADQKASDQYYSRQVNGQSNFISEVFFLALAAHNYGTEAASSLLSQLEKDLKHMEKQIEGLEGDRQKYINNPAQLAVFDRALKKYKDQIDKGHSYKLAVQGVLLDDLSQARSMQFMRYVIIWLLRVASPRQNIPKDHLRLPLPAEQNEVFKYLPEYFLDVVVGNFKFIMRNMPQVITSTQSDELVVLCITFLQSSEYIKNPYLKSGLVTILYHGIWPVYGRSKGVLGDLLKSSPFATEHLLHALMKFYIEAENTGTHTQFFDKFNIRYEIFQIVKCIWDNTIYRERLSQESKVNVDFFVRFVNLLLNDVTFVLDESLSGFAKIHDLQEELAATDSTMDSAARTEKEEALADARGKAKSYMQLTNETVSMLKLFTEALADSFTMPEIVKRLADMLDYNLDAMVGQKSAQLKVENASEYGFNPRILLAEIVDVYLNLRGKENFIFAVARDGRSYKPTNFEKATLLLRRYNLKSPDELRAWTALGEKFKRAKEVDDQAEMDLGEIPDEYLDPLMYTLMEDPVILPTSKTRIDRSTIRSHLLSDPNDPFNRVPLRIEDVIPDVELKAQIEAFKAEKKGKAIADASVMDMSDDHAA